MESSLQARLLPGLSIKIQRSNGERGAPRPRVPVDFSSLLLPKLQIPETLLRLPSFPAPSGRGLCTGAGSSLPRTVASPWSRGNGRGSFPSNLPAKLGWVVGSRPLNSPQETTFRVFGFLVSRLYSNGARAPGQTLKFL